MTSELMVTEGHPGHGYAYLEENSHHKIPLISIPDGHMCQLKDLQLNCNNVNSDVENKRERYAKTALLLFHPFRCLEDLQTDGKYWPMFDACRQKHFQSNAGGNSNNNDTAENPAS